MDEQMTRVVVHRAGGPEALKVERSGAPTAGADDIVIRVESAGVAFGDVQARQGRFPGRMPMVPGYDVVGRVAEIGAAVDDLVVGQRVAALTVTGGYATMATAKAAWTVPVPDDLDAPSVSALVLNYLTAWQMLHRVARVPAGGSILVLGAAGGVGSALCQLAGLDDIRVYGTASAGRQAGLRSHGVTVVADQAGVPERVDAVFDSVGGPSLAASRRAASPGGVVVAYGMSFAIAEDLSRAAGLARAAIALGAAKVRPGPKVAQYVVVSRAKKDPAALRADLTHLIGLLAAGDIRPAVTVLPLAEAAEAHRRLEAREVVGKLVLVP